MSSEAFTPEICVDACIGIACNLGIAGRDDSLGHPHVMQNDGTGCGHENNQFVQIEDNKLVGIVEVNTPKDQGNLEAFDILLNNGTSALNQTQDYLNGKTINWKTKGTFTWNGKEYTWIYEHKGTFVTTGQSANHS